MTDQRRNALDRANETRSEGKRFKQKVASGRLPLHKAVLTCDLPIRVPQLLQAKRGVGGTKAAKWMRLADLKDGGALSFAPTNNGRQITQAERQRLAEVVQGKRPSPKRTITPTAIRKESITKHMASAGCTPEQIHQVVEAIA